MQLLETECGPNIIESFRKVKAQKTALEGLCRALQEDKRRNNGTRSGATEPQIALATTGVSRCVLDDTGAFEADAASKDEAAPESRDAASARSLGPGSLQHLAIKATTDAQRGVEAMPEAKNHQGSLATDQL